MRFHVDESTGRRLHILLKEAGHDSLFVGDVKISSNDEDVLASSENEKKRFRRQVHLSKNPDGIHSFNRNSSGATVLTYCLIFFESASSRVTKYDALQLRAVAK